MKKKLMAMIVMMCTLVMGACDRLAVFDPKGPVAKTQAHTILLSMGIVFGVLLVVYILFVFVLVKYRAGNLPDGYEPPHEEGSKLLEVIWTAIPVIIVVILSVITVKSTNAVETVPKGHEHDKPLVIYASSSNWKWHFSYPEQGVETVNYVNIPTNRDVEFRLYSYGPITSFWVPQLAGQKYAMSDMVTKLNIVANEAGSYLGKNSNFSGKGFAGMDFEVQAMNQDAFNSWVKDVKSDAPKLSEKEFNKLLKPGHLGRLSFSSTHLSFSQPPGEMSGGHHMNMDMNMDSSSSGKEGHKMEGMSK
jgi:cytochrome aa3-600 menaquinol oxidase subunit 2